MFCIKVSVFRGFRRHPKAASKEAVFPNSTDTYWMAQAIKVMKSVGKAAPNPTVGCVFVKDGKLVAQGATGSFGGLHAEKP